MNDENKRKIQWQPIIELSIVLFTILGSTIPLYLHTDSKIDAHRLETAALIKEMQSEFKEMNRDLKEMYKRICDIENQR